MSTKNNYSVKMMMSYLKHFYTPSYCTKHKQAFYNPRNRGHLLIDTTIIEFTAKEVTEFFEENNQGIDLPVAIEYCRFRLYVHEQCNQ